LQHDHCGNRLGQKGQRSFHYVKRHCHTGRVIKCPLFPLSQGFHFPQSGNDVRFNEFLFDTPRKNTNNPPGVIVDVISAHSPCFDHLGTDYLQFFGGKVVCGQCAVNIDKVADSVLVVFKLDFVLSGLEVVKKSGDEFAHGNIGFSVSWLCYTNYQEILGSCLWLGLPFGNDTGVFLSGFW